MHIVIAEDDYTQAEYCEESIRERFPDVTISSVASEKEFRDALEGEWRSTPPDVFVIDVMLYWCRPSRNISPPPPDVQHDGHYRAGIRCAQLVRDTLGAQPYIALLTVLARDSLLSPLPSQVEYIRKRGRFVELVAWLERLTKSTQTAY